VITRILLCHAPPSSQSEARPSASRNSRNAKQRGWFSAQFHDADQGLQIRTTRDATWQNTLQKLIATERIASIEVCPVKVIGETSAVCCLVAIFRRKFKETRSRHTRAQKATADQDAELCALVAPGILVHVTIIYIVLILTVACATCIARLDENILTINIAWLTQCFVTAVTSLLHIRGSIQGKTLLSIHCTNNFPCKSHKMIHDNLCIV
jgi:hypothetical protein